MKTPTLTGNRIRKYLAEGKRFDGRGPDEFREIVIETGVLKNGDGSARVKIGKTEVLVGIKMAMGTPYPDSQDKGTMMVTTELLPLSSPRFEYGPPKFPSIELARVIDRGIRESNFIDFSKLCVEVGEKVWTVFIDIYTINDDGNIMDAAGIAAVAALKNAKMPKFDKEEGKVLYGELTENPLPLKKDVTIPITIHQVGDNFLVDPTREEEDLSETRVTIGSNSKGIISSMQKAELKSLSIKEFEGILDLSEKVNKDVLKKIEKSLK
ncbi:exosome complex protein Rrp42 [Candidatus Pacearchaeota archaeon]|nr:exosome complex protein Rrp42 [Candidatus Pacearchaeota archaeon]